MLALRATRHTGTVYPKVLFPATKENRSATDFTMVGRYKCHLLYINPVRLLFREHVENSGIISYYADEYPFKFHVDPCMRVAIQNLHKRNNGRLFIFIKFQLF